MKEQMMFNTPDSMDSLMGWVNAHSGDTRVHVMTGAMMMYNLIGRDYREESEMLQKLLSGGMMISVNPEAPHEFGLVADDGELVLCATDWSLFIEECKCLE